MLKLNNLPSFVTAVECGGFAPASRELGVPKSTVSKRVAELEEELKTRLIHRTSRSFQLTDAGREFYRHARAVLIEAEAAEHSVRSRQAEPAGRVRITASVPVAQLYLAEHLPRLAATWPRLDLQLDVTDRHVDLLREDYDIAVRCHFEPLPDSELIQRPVSQEPFILVAAPSYLHGRSPLGQPHDLEKHEGLLIAPDRRTWHLSHKSGETAAVAPRCRFVANESVVLVGAAKAGLGVACLPESLCRPALRAGQLLHLLPDWNGGTVTTTLLLPYRRGQLPGVRAAVEFLAECLKPEGALSPSGGACA